MAILEVLEEGAGTENIDGKGLISQRSLSGFMFFIANK
jgi:hypothetical protein